MPPQLVVGAARAMMYGNSHSGREAHDWQSIRPSLFAAALIRHQLRWWMKEPIDKASGLHHLDLIAANTAILQWFREVRGEDSIEGWQP